MGLVFDMWEVEDAPKWLLDKLSSEGYDQLTKIAMTMWGIWFFCNKKIRENRVVTSQFVVECSFKQLQDSKDAVAKNMGSQHQRATTDQMSK